MVGDHDHDHGRGLVVVSWLVVFCVAAYLMALPVRDFLIHFSIADGLSYARVAFNVAHGQGSTYDGITRTNGYHPLWMWLHVPLMFGADSAMSRMYLVRILWVGTTLAAVAVWSRLVYRLSGDHLGAAVVVLATGGFGWSVYVMYAGVETPLVVLLLGVSLLWSHTLVGDSSPSIGSCVWLGLAMAAGFLARLDSIFVLGPLGLIVLNHLRRVSMRHVLAWLVLVVGLPAPYLLWNVVSFGGLLPVSGRVKTLDGIDLARSVKVFTGWMEHKSAVLPAGTYAIGAGLVLVGLVLSVWLIRKLARGWPEVFRVLWVLPVGAVMHYVYYLVKMREVNVPWHLYPQVMTLYVGLAFFCVVSARCFTLRWLKAARISIFVALLAALTVGTVFYAQVKSKRRPGVALSFEVADWIRGNLPSGTRIAAYDSFNFAIGVDDVSFVDLNGLVGDAELADLARARKQAEIIDRYECEYVVTWIDSECYATGDRDAYVHLSHAARGSRDWVLAVVDAAAYKRAWARSDPDRLPCP